MNIENKRLYKSREDRKICGVCAGVAEYLNLDPTVIRLIWAATAFCGIGFPLYLVAAVIMPE